MILVDKEKSKAILDKISHMPMEHFPGGSVSNTLAGVANLGGKVGFCGKIGKDSHGEMYETTLEKEGINHQLHKCNEDLTGHSITFITPDKERTFVTHLGAAINLKKMEFVDEDLKKSKIIHLEGYQLELPEVKDLVYHAAIIAKENNILISIDLSDPALIKRNLQDFKAFVKEYADIVFANEEEAKAYAETDTEEEALHIIAKDARITCVKLGAKGSLIKAGETLHTIAPVSTTPLSLTGAGDMYAAGILYGIANDIPLEKAGKIASYAASKVVAQIPARLSEKLDYKVKELL